MTAAVALLFALLGILVPFWGFVCIGILIACVGGDSLVALVIALFADIFYGPPIMFHILWAPFTVVTLCLLFLRYLLFQKLRHEGSGYL